MKFMSRFLIPVCTLLAGRMFGARSYNDMLIEDFPGPPISQSPKRNSTTSMSTT